jgi:PAS domain S-box-containing protein
MCGVARALRTGKPQMTEGQYEKEPGKILYYQIRFFPAKDDGGEISQVVVVIQDITEKKLNELEIARLNEFNQRIFDASPVSIIVMNQDGRIVAANWLARSLMEKPTDELIGSKLLETPEIKGTPELYEQYQKLLSRGRPLYFHNLQYIEEKTGQERFMNLIAVPLTGPDQQVEGAISMALDNTRSVLANRKMDKLNEELEGKVAKRTWQLDKANRRLRKVLELKSKFLTDASHELRTPLTVIQGNLDLAVQECRLRKRKEPEIFSIIKKEVEYMSGILSDLTMLTNADDGEERLRLEQVKLPEIVATVTQSLGVLAKQKGIRLRSCQKGSGPWVIKGDETKLEKMLSNMVRNGINYTSAGGRVDITLEKIKEGFNLRVKDTGVGIARQEFSNIFERFYRVDKARSRADGGTGLGLSICKWIAEAHGGRIEVESEIGKGSEFTVFLPSREYLEKNQTLFA